MRSIGGLPPNRPTALSSFPSRTRQRDPLSSPFRSPPPTSLLADPIGMASVAETKVVMDAHTTDLVTSVKEGLASMKAELAKELRATTPSSPLGRLVRLPGARFRSRWRSAGRPPTYRNR